MKTSCGNQNYICEKHSYSIQPVPIIHFNVLFINIAWEIFKGNIRYLLCGYFSFTQSRCVLKSLKLFFRVYFVGK